MTKKEITDWHRADILAAIQKKNSSLSRLSQQNSMHPRTLHNVFYKKWPKAEKIIADFIQVAPEEIWPSRYTSADTEKK